jgi:ATP-dependent helicase/nuclease subunit A
MILTRSQESALDLKKHMAIIANAGSGKTAVLVERYLRILEENRDLHPRNVAAITFTDSSARDLKKKIANSLNERLISCDDRRVRERLLEIKRQLGSAYISTIHSFCIQLLRSYPVEANVDAAFSILTAPEDQLLREECVRSAFYAILKSGYEDDNSPEARLLPVFRLLGRRKLSALIHSFLGSRFRLNELIGSFYRKGDSDILKFWEEQVRTLIKDEILDPVNISFFETLLREKTTMGQARQNAEAALSAFSMSESNTSKLQRYSELIHAFYTKEFTLSGRLFSPETKEIYYHEAASAVANFVRYSGLIHACIESAGNNKSTAVLYLDYSRQLVEIFSIVLHTYSKQKINYSLLDYDDVIESTLRLVRIPEIQEELVKRFPHILIDEYQDTDAAQYAIAKALTGSFQAENRLTIVGDPKQSIYSFRNADLELYEETIREIETSSFGNSQVILSETFRILSHPLAFVNKVSEYLFGAASGKAKSLYSPLIEGRPDRKEGSVEFIIPEKGDEYHSQFVDETAADPDKDEVSSREVEFIPRKILQIVNDRTGAYFIEDKQEDTIESRPPHFNEIAILLRSRTHQGILESELRKNGIPFVIYGGRGFYAQPEIVDITNYLRFLLNPNDDIALVGLLRSPYFGFSDIDLFRLAPKEHTEINLWQRLVHYDIISARSHISRAVSQLSENLQIAGRVNTQFLLRKIIEETGILGIMQSLPQGHQKIANLEKYTGFALAFGKEGYSGTFDFIERITLLMERDEMEAQAEPRTDLNAVHLMTIHNSKGLEFPVVFLPYLHAKLSSRDRRNMWNTLDKTLGIGIELPEESHCQPIVELIKIRSKEKDIQEEKRIFYVALTRARDHLILSASPKDSFVNTRMGWVFESLGLENLPVTGSSIMAPTTIQRYTSDCYSSDAIDLCIPLIRRKTDIPITELLPTEVTELPNTTEFQLQNVEPSESIGRYSPTQLLTYLECPTKYYLRYQLGFPEDVKLPYFNEADTLAEQVQGSLLGQIVHKVLERTGSFISPEFIDIALLKDTFLLVCNDLHLSADDRTKFAKRVKTDIENVFSSAIGRQSLTAQQYQSELSLRLKLETGQVLSGIIDKLFLDDEGIWNILDYKTDLRESVQKNERYEFQLNFYAYLVSRLHLVNTVKAHILYTHSGNTRSFTFTANDFTNTGALLQSLVSEIRVQKKIRSLKDIERRLSHCHECPYFHRASNLCVAGTGTIHEVIQTEFLFEE